MKYIWLSLMTLVLAVCTAQDSPFTYTEVVKNDSVSGGVLYKRVKTWIDTTYTSAQSVTLSDDSINKIIVIKAAFIVHVTDGFVRDGGNVKYTITFQCKDGRYKIMLADFIHYHGTSDLGDGGDLNKTKPAGSLLNLPRYYWHQIKEQAAEHRNSLITSIKQVLGHTDKASPNNDW